MSNLDGAPKDYTQQYDSDEGPFTFPIESRYVVKKLGAPTPVEREIILLILRSLRTFTPFGLVGVYLQGVFGWIVYGIGIAIFLRATSPIFTYFYSEIMSGAAIALQADQRLRLVLGVLPFVAKRLQASPTLPPDR